MKMVSIKNLTAILLIKLLLICRFIIQFKEPIVPLVPKHFLKIILKKIFLELKIYLLTFYQKIQVLKFIFTFIML